ncbi:DUF6933 domain-containing protein [Pseudomonas sp. Y24-6]|uniref:DUF6933 domain-containing protein n=1 Tax=Pseudomonas sp. Y24-6 TaxID=2750013 RepID=UPI001CE0FCEF|nr:hypothetical protein [Pseudomonas sp. Y24-6]MCA4965839.1 hypothetical protein [Pseudomonas sp. Y24-6]
MLIFNCTEAASKFFSRVHKGKTVTPVNPHPPSPTPEEDETGDSAEQWLVHAISVQRKHVLLVIHLKTRYCMVFADAKKADVEAFTQRFTERWICGLMRYALQHDVLQWVKDEPMMKRFEVSNREYVLYKRRHRGAQKHIDDISWFFQDCAAEWGALPPDEYAAQRFDARMNGFIRGSKGVKDYFIPNEEMMVHWLRKYCALDEPMIKAACDRRKEVEQEVRELERQIPQG